MYKMNSWFYVIVSNYRLTLAKTILIVLINKSLHAYFNECKAKSKKFKVMVKIKVMKQSSTCVVVPMDI